MMSRQQISAYRHFYNSVRRNETLDPKVTLLIHLAASMAIGCYP